MRIGAVHIDAKNLFAYYVDNNGEFINIRLYVNVYLFYN